MGNAVLYNVKKLSEVKAIVESFEKSGILVTQEKVSLQTNWLATQLLKIKDQFECLVKHIETIERAKYTSAKKQCKQSKNFTSVKTQHSSYIKKKMQNNDISKIMNMKRPYILSAVWSLLQHS